MNYPQDFINKVICGDCLKVMKNIPDKSVDLVVTSPPYNMGNKSLGYQPKSTVGQKHYDKYNDDKVDDKYISFCNDVLEECLRVSGYVFWNVQFIRSTRNHIFDIQNTFRDNLKDIFIWKKQCVSSITANNGGMGKGWEYVFMFGENNKSIFEYNNFIGNKYVPNIQTWYKREFFTEHHATFPLELPQYFIKYFTKDNDIILDPFLGSGTTAVAAKRLNRDFMGIEISEKYCEMARQRLRQGVLPI